ncbi:hypothetical protein BDV18DRAFT_4007 [Aspergillus unguis]
MRNISGGGFTSSSLEDSSLASDVQNLQDSVSKRRRHAVYFHRPPVWRYSSLHDGTSSPDMSEDLDGSGRASNEDFWMGSLPMTSPQKANVSPYVVLPDSDSGHETPLLENQDFPGEWALSDCRHFSERMPDPHHQQKPIFCTRLQSYKDIRLGVGEQWAIQEGSLVIGLGREHTLLGNHERQMDEFEVSSGDVYIVCSLYADLWALCAKVSSNPSPEDDDHMRVAFLPLCAVTLAPNYSAFIQRNIRCTEYFGSQEEDCPGNGLPVVPPRRSHSLTASKQIFCGLGLQISLPLPAQKAIQTLALKPAEEEFVPLDSTLEPILSPLADKRRSLLRWKSPGSKTRDSPRQEPRGKQSRSLNPSLASVYSKVRSKSDGWRRLRRFKSSSSGGSQETRRLWRRSDRFTL